LGLTRPGGDTFLVLIRLIGAAPSLETPTKHWQNSTACPSGVAERLNNLDETRQRITEYPRPRPGATCSAADRTSIRQGAGGGPAAEREDGAMIEPVATTAAETWQPLIDWGGALIAHGARLAVADGRLVVAGPAWLLTPPVRAALDRHERELVGLLLRADEPDVGWRLEAMLADLARRPATWCPKARAATAARPGRIRCPSCARALQVAFRRARGRPRLRRGESAPTGVLSSD
jgi:hypothetical protein